jgi:multiple sugar transport system permease protein
MTWVAKALRANHRPRAFLALVLSFIAVFPIYFMIVGSISPVETFLRRDLGEILLPRAFVGDHLAVVAFDPVFLRFALNSMIVATATTVVSVTIATLGAYSLARLRFPGSEVLGRFVLLTYTVPSVLLLIPLFKIVVTLNLANNLIALVITYTTFSVPFCLWLLRSYFQSLPRDLEEAAMVDGASRLGALFRVILPLSIPGIVATGLFAFILAWNEFLFALVFTTTSDVKTLPIGVSTTFTAEQTATDWAVAMSASTLSAVPIFIIVLILQRGLVRGITAGAVKG